MFVRMGKNGGEGDDEICCNEGSDEDGDGRVAFPTEKLIVFIF